MLEQSVICPYCWESITLLLDLPAGVDVEVKP